MPGRGVDRGLEVEAADRVGEPEAQLPLVLLVAAGVRWWSYPWTLVSCIAAATRTARHWCR